MTDKHKSEQKPANRRTAEQNAQARLVLIQLLWLFMAIIVAGIVWLANNQRKLSLHVEERLKITDTFNSRMNDMDDRIFAMAPTDTQPVTDGSAQNDLQLTAIQLATAQRLYFDGDYKAAIEILTAIDWQLGNDALNLSAPIKSALKTAIKQDISAINTLRNQTDPWQADMIRLRQLQNFTKTLKGEGILQKELILHDINLLITLTLGVAAMRERETMVIYLNEMLVKYRQLQPFYPLNDTESLTTADSGDIDSINKAITVVETLINAPPRLAPLKSFELLNSK